MEVQGFFYFNCDTGVSGERVKPPPGKAAAGPIVANRKDGKMAKEATGAVEDAGAADLQKPGENPQSDVQVEGTPAAEENQVEGLEAGIAAERTKRQEAEEKAESLQDQMNLMAANPPQVQPTAAQKTLYANVAERLSIDPELATPEENGQIFEMMMQVTLAQQTQQSFVDSKPDYAQVVGVPLSNGQFQMAPPLLRIIKDNPALAQSLSRNPDPKIAYALASKDPQYVKEKAEKAKPDDIKASEKAEAAIKEAAKKLSVSAASGGGVTDKQAEIAGMNDEQFDDYIEKLKSEA